MTTSHVNSKGQTMYSNDDPGSWKGDVFVPADAPPMPGPDGGVGLQARSNDPQVSDDPQGTWSGNIPVHAKGGPVRSRAVNQAIAPQTGRRNYAKGGPIVDDATLAARGEAAQAETLEEYENRTQKGGRK